MFANGAFTHKSIKQSKKDMYSLTILDTIRLVHPAREMAELIVSLEKIQHGHLKKKKNNMEICFMFDLPCSESTSE
jgi:hypothetical protein